MAAKAVRPAGRQLSAERAPGACAAFTLLELMIVCSLLAILLALAVPGYQRHVQRAERSAAIEILLAAAACQERIYADEFSYDTGRCQVSGVQHGYRFRFEPPDSPPSAGYTIIAEPLAGRRDDSCGTLTLDQSGRRGISGPDEQLRRCWAGR
jgi:type IV pilus assembly protein PilE